MDRGDGIVQFLCGKPEGQDYALTALGFHVLQNIASLLIDLSPSPNCYVALRLDDHYWQANRFTLCTLAVIEYLLNRPHLLPPPITHYRGYA